MRSGYDILENALNGLIFLGLFWAAHSTPPHAGANHISTVI
jgi:hypothetical protein